MLAFLFAVVSLTNIDPEAIVTPAPLVRGTTNAGSGFAPGDASLPAGLTADIDVPPVCTFGMPRFGSDVWSDASALSRTIAPQCAGTMSPFGAGFGASAFGGYGSSPFGYAPPWLGVTSNAVRPSEPVVLHTISNEPKTIVRFYPTRTTRAMPEPAFEARPAEPARAGARAVNTVRTMRGH